MQFVRTPKILRARIYLLSKKEYVTTLKVDNGGFDPPTSRMLSVRSTN